MMLFQLIQKKGLVLLLIYLSFLNCYTFHSTQKIEKKPKKISEKPYNGIQALWIGHATVLFQLEDRWFITDPVFRESIGFFLKRYVEPGIEIKSLPKIDLILISHSHHDHLDLPTLEKLNSSTNLAFPSGIIDCLPELKRKNSHPLKIWESAKIGEIVVTAVPAEHIGGRVSFSGFCGENSYSGFIVEYQDLTVFFAGDTSYNPNFFKKIGQKFDIDLALIPIGPMDPSMPVIGDVYSYFRKKVHTDLDEAVKIFLDIKAKWMIPIHHSTFFSSREDTFPIIEAYIEKSIIKNQILFLDFGEFVRLPRQKKKYN
jgi:L-ascorbate metabolism protein UlaG (beta-lactamase superfamily)